MRTALLLALLGAFVAVSYASCPYVSYYSCEKDYKLKKCKAVEVCEKAYKEKCGHDYCEYPYICASLKKEECKKYVALKSKCGYKKKVCKDVKYPCGHGSCSYYQDCVKDTKCYYYSGYNGYRKLLSHGKSSASATAVAVAKGGHAHASSYAVALAHAKKGGPVGHKKVYPYYKHGRYEDSCYSYGGCGGYYCEDSYKCVAKAPCKDVVAKKCVKSHYKPGFDLCHGGHHFDFVHSYKKGDKCGKDYCGDGYKCATVYYQQCKKKCGDSYCDYGHECGYEDYHEADCKDYAYLDTICKEYYEPICVLVPGYLRLKYKAPCKTVYKCEYEDSYCGDKYCGYGYYCAVNYKKVCGKKYYPKYYTSVYSDPHYYDYGHSGYYPGYHYGSYATAHSEAHSYGGYGGYGGHGGHNGYGHGGHGHGGHGRKPGSEAYSSSHANEHGTNAYGHSYQYKDGVSGSVAKAGNKHGGSAVLTKSIKKDGKTAAFAASKAVAHKGHHSAVGHAGSGR